MRKNQFNLFMIVILLLAADLSAQRVSFQTSYFMPFREKVLQLKVDSSHFIKSDIVKGNYPVLNRKKIAKVKVYSHCSERQLSDVNLSNSADHLFLLTDSLAIVNRDQCPFNSADLSSPDIDAVFTIFSDKKSFQRIMGGGSNCFFPRHSFLFLDESGKVSGYFEVCFQCDMVLSSPNFSKKFEGNFKGEGERKLKEILKRNGISLLDNSDQ